MKLSDEEKQSILEEMRDQKLQQDISLISGKPKKMDLLDYLDFLTALSNLSPKQFYSSPDVHYKKVIF